VKGIVQFKGKHMCDWCIKKGDYSEGCMFFLHGIASLRNGDFF
jgi:hypothetical protein